MILDRRHFTQTEVAKQLVKKITGAHPENHNSDPGAESDDVIQRDVLILPLDDTGPDQMPPVCPDGA